MKDERERERRGERGGLMDFYGTGWRRGVKRGSAWKVEGERGDYLDAPFNHFIPDSIRGTRESCQCIQYVSVLLSRAV
jgi:signal peptidase complex subunit 3